MDNEDPRPRPPQSEELTYHGAPRCTAKSTQSGERCKKARIPGTNVCGTHGGRAPQVQRKARLRLLELVDPAIAKHARILATTQDEKVALKAVEMIYDRTGMGRQQEVSVADAREALREKIYEMRNKQLEDDE